MLFPGLSSHSDRRSASSTIFRRSLANGLINSPVLLKVGNLLSFENMFHSCDKHMQNATYASAETKTLARLPFGARFNSSMADAVCTYTWAVLVYTYDATPQGRKYEHKFAIPLCLCLLPCVVSVNRDEAIKSTRRSCSRRTGSPVGLMSLWLCLCLCRTRKLALIEFVTLTVIKSQSFPHHCW